MEAFAERVTTVLNDAIHSLSLGGDDTAHTASLVQNLEAIQIEMASSLSLTLLQEKLLRSDLIKCECEQSTKNDELFVLQTKLSCMRKEREERRVELENELVGLKKLFDKKRHDMDNMHKVKEESVLRELGSQRAAFDREVDALKGKQQDFAKQYNDQRAAFADKELNLGANISSLNIDVQKRLNDYEAVAMAKQTDIGAVRLLLGQQKALRLELENHFTMVDMNQAKRKQENERLRSVHELEQKAVSLLWHGAVALQKHWRGRKDRALAVAVKNKKTKKKKTK
jgi:hypothetical protein